MTSTTLESSVKADKRGERCLRVVIEAQIVSGAEGGIEQYLIGLVHGLGRLAGDHESYTIATADQGPDWIDPHAGPNTSVVRAVKYADPPEPWWMRLFRTMGAAFGMVSRRVRRALQGPFPWPPLEVAYSDGFYESLDPDVLHITYPYHFVVSSVPTIYTIHDLQHRHLPEFFPRESLEQREFLYSAAFERSKAVIAISKCVKRDLIRQYAVPAEKIYTIPAAPPTDAYIPIEESALARVREQFELPDSFLLYPAMTYPHKNHVRLMEAIALLRDRDGLQINLICTGGQKLHWPVIQKRLEELDLTGQVRFLGFIASHDLRCLFRLADMMVFPSMFEGAGIPLLEAFREGTAVVCSDIAPFREFGGDAPIFFDCRSVGDMADALRRAATGKDVLAGLRARSRQRRGLYSWDRSAAMYRAVYRKLGQAALTEEDRMYLSECQQ